MELNEILQNHNVSSVNQLNCNQLSDKELAVIGDYFMEQAHPGEAHEQMDAMMGGEGSESLREMHISMAKNNLGCSVELNGGENNTMYSNMMGSWSYGGLGVFNSALGVVTWVLFMAFLVAATRYFWKKGSKK